MNLSLNLLSPKIIGELLSKYNSRPSKGLGQNFLVDEQVLDKIVVAADLKPEDTVIEVGPGIGTLTIALAQRVKKVIAIEKDRLMIDILAETLHGYSNIELIKDDALLVELKKSGIKNYKVVANIPYYLTSPLIRRFLENPPTQQPPSTMVLMVQKEVAQRICAQPPHMSLLAVSVQLYATPIIVSFVTNKSFWPAPKIDSAIIKISNINRPTFSKAFQKWRRLKEDGRELTAQEHQGEHQTDLQIERFFFIVKAGFSQPRKQLANNFATAFKKPRPIIEHWLLKNNIQPQQRAQTLSIKDWKNLAQTCE